jgi:hypothetical protein
MPYIKHMQMKSEIRTIRRHVWENNAAITSQTNACMSAISSSLFEYRTVDKMEQHDSDFTYLSIILAPHHESV